MTDETIAINPEVEEIAQEEAAQDEQIGSDSSEPVTEESEKEPEPEKKPRKDLLSRVNQLTKQKNDAIAEAEYWKTKASESEGSRRDLAEHEADRAQSKADSISRDTWQAKVESAKAEFADYDEVVTKSKAHVEPHVANAVLESELGPKLFHYLAKNPSELEQLNDMTERGALKHIAKLEVMLETKKAEVRTSKAPEPIKPVTSARGVVAKNPQDMNIDEYTAWRRSNGAKW